MTNEYLNLEKTLTDQQKKIFDELKEKLNTYVENSVKDNETKLKDELHKIKVSAMQINKNCDYTDCEQYFFLGKSRTRKRRI